SYKSDKYVGDVDSDSDHEIEFAPPKHYHQVDASKKFKNQINDNKEIWLIKTPKNFPISKLKSLPVSFTSTSITNGPKTFDLGEKNYQVNEENLSNNEEVRKYSLIANRKIVSNKKIDRFYHISEYVNIPKINYDQVKTPRENVKVIENLKMRHFPTGY
ncbi:RNA polymerase I, subunit RPA34.5, partial [Hyphopichia burtonii NRRL Y-1933]